MSERALLLGQEPEVPLGFSYVTEAPYAAVVIGSLSIAALLQYDFPAALTACMAGIPVYLWQPGLEHRRLGGCDCPALYARCLAVERELAQWGIRLTQDAPKPPLITALQAQRLLAAGTVPHSSRMTPLARDILGETQMK